MKYKFDNILKAEAKYNSKVMYIVSIFVIFVCYFIIEIENLSNNTLSILIDRILPLIGIVSIFTLFLPESNENIKDILKIKDGSLMVIYLIRLTYRIIFVSTIVIIYSRFIYKPNEFYKFSESILHIISNFIFVGGISLFIYSISKNITATTIIGLFYMTIQWFIKFRYFYLYNIRDFILQNDLINIIIGIFFIFWAVYIQIVYNKR
jgi:membrane protein